MPYLPNKAREQSLLHQFLTELPSAVSKTHNNWPRHKHITVATMRANAGSVTGLPGELLWK